MALTQQDIKISANVLGKGSYATVFSGEMRGKEVALKVFNTNDNTITEIAKREASVMKLLGEHPNIIKYYGNYVQQNDTPVIVMEKADKPLLMLFREEKTTSKPLTFEVLKSRALQVCYGLKHLHDKKVSHGDIACKNIVVSSDGVLKWCDLGYAMRLDKDACYDPCRRCTLATAAPEFLSSGERTLSADIYSLGMVLLELAKRDNAYSTFYLQKYEGNEGFNYDLFVNDVIYGARPTIPDGVPNEYANIVRACLIDEHTSYRKRPTIDEVIARLSSWTF